MSAIVLQNGMVHYEVLGRGRPVVFLHSWVGSWRYWIPTMQSLSTNYRTYALDLWGFGESAKVEYNYTIDQQIDLISRFLSEMGIIKAAFIGHGLGSIVAMNFAKTEPSRVDRMLMVAYPQSREFINDKLGNKSPSALADWMLGQDSSFDAARREASKTDEKAILASLTDWQYDDLANIIDEINIPTLLVNGLADPAVQYPDSLNETLLPELGHHVAFSESGHYPMIEEASKFNRLVSEFMSLESGASPRDLGIKETWKRRVR